MCANGDPFWPGAYVDRVLDYELLMQHFAMEKFAVALTKDQAKDAVNDARRANVPTSETETRTWLRPWLVSRGLFAANG